MMDVSAWMARRERWSPWNWSYRGCEFSDTGAGDCTRVIWKILTAEPFQQGLERKTGWLPVFTELSTWMVPGRTSGYEEPAPLHTALGMICKME